MVCVVLLLCYFLLYLSSNEATTIWFLYWKLHGCILIPLNYRKIPLLNLHWEMNQICQAPGSIFCLSLKIHTMNWKKNLTSIDWISDILKYMDYNEKCNHLLTSFTRLFVSLYLSHPPPPKPFGWNKLLEILRFKVPEFILSLLRCQLFSLSFSL